VVGTRFVGDRYSKMRRHGMPRDLGPHSLWMAGLLGTQGLVFCLILRPTSFVLLLLLMGSSCLFVFCLVLLDVAYVNKFLPLLETHDMGLVLYCE